MSVPQLIMTYAHLSQGSFLATCGQNRIINVFNRQGEEAAEIPLEGSGCAAPHAVPTLA